MFTARNLSTFLLASAFMTASADATTFTFLVTLDGSKEVPPVATAATGTATVTLDDVTGIITVSGTYTGMTPSTSAAHIHGAASECMTAGVVFPLTHTGGSSGTLSGSTVFGAARIRDVLDCKTYINVHSGMFPGGEIRGQIANGTSFCDGCDGALGLCPCANPGLPETGCDNAQSTGGVRLTAPVYTPDGFGGGTFTLEGTGYPPMSSPTAIIIRSTSVVPPVVFGDGLRCIGLAGLVRFGATAAVGGVSTHVGSHGAGAGTFKYQLWYRNTPITFCDATAAFNLSNGLSLDW